MKKRIDALRAAWPEAGTVSSFRNCLAFNDIAIVLRWRGKKLAVVAGITDARQAAEVETAKEVVLAYAHLNASTKLAGVRAVTGVGPKPTTTWRFLLAGST